MSASFDRERVLFTIAKELGYTGEEPSIVGTYAACKALDDVKTWLSNREPPPGHLWRKQWWEYLEPTTPPAR